MLHFWSLVLYGKWSQFAHQFAHQIAHQSEVGLVANVDGIKIKSYQSWYFLFVVDMMLCFLLCVVRGFKILFFSCLVVVVVLVTLVFLFTCSFFYFEILLNDPHCRQHLWWFEKFGTATVIGKAVKTGYLLVATLIVTIKFKISSEQAC